jgi:putative DNA primase/helicase
VIDIEDGEESQDDLDKAGGIDVSRHERDYTWLADMCLGRLNKACRVDRGAVGIRRCSGFWFVYNGRVFERHDSERMATLVRPILNRCWFMKPQGQNVVRVDLNPTTSTINETMQAMVSLPGVFSEAEPDQNEDELIVANGRVDLATGKLSAFSARVFATRQVKVELPTEDDPDLDEARVRWVAYLDSLELGAPTLDYLRRAFGYALTGRGCEKAFFFLHGEKNTSKTTLLRLVMEVVGRTNAGGYAADTECNDWLERGAQGASHTDSLMGIEGARLVFGDETGENARFNEARIKRAIGGAGSTLRMSAKAEKGRDVPMRFGLFFSSNHLPSTQDNATQDRLKLITHTKVVENPDPSFQRRFMTPAMRQVVLQWLVGAAQEYLKNGLGLEPPSVLIARANYAQENDWFGSYLSERIGVRRNLWQGNARPLAASDISRDLTRWASEVGMKRAMPSANRLPMMVSERTGIKARVLGGRKVFDGLALRVVYGPEGREENDQLDDLVLVGQAVVE